MKKVELVKGTVFELDPKKNYLICFDNRVISRSDLQDLMRKMPAGKASIAVMLKGDPSTAVKVIAQDQVSSEGSGEQQTEAQASPSPEAAQERENK